MLPKTPLAILSAVLCALGPNADSPAAQGGAPEACNAPVFYCGYQDPIMVTACGMAQCPSSSGCRAALTTSNVAGHPDSGQGDYWVRFHGAENGKPAILFYGFAQAQMPFSSGLLCVAAPIKRTPVGSTGGNPAYDCTGSHGVCVNDPAASWNQAPGTVICYQGWLRDPQSTSGTDVTDAVELTFNAGGGDLCDCPGTTAWSCFGSTPYVITYSAGAGDAYLISCSGPDTIAVYAGPGRMYFMDAGDSIRVVTLAGDSVMMRTTPMGSSGGCWKQE